MFRFEKTSVIKATRADLYRFFLDPGNLAKFSPEDFQVTELNAAVPLTESAEFSLKAKIGGVKFVWQGRVLVLDPPKRIVDEQVRGPFKQFVHTHQFREIGSHTFLIDAIEYQPRFGPLAALVDKYVIRPRLQRLFDYRHERLKELFEGVKPPGVQ